MTPLSSSNYPLETLHTYSCFPFTLQISKGTWPNELKNWLKHQFPGSCKLSLWDDRAEKLHTLVQQKKWTADAKANNISYLL